MVVRELVVREVSAAGVIVDEEAAVQWLVGVRRKMVPEVPAWVSHGLGGEGTIAEEGMLS